MTKRQFGITLMCAIAAGLLGGAAMTGILAGSSAQAASAVIEASEFRVVDGDGNVRASLGVDSNDNVRLSFTQADRTTRIWTGITNTGTAMVNMSDDDGDTRVFVQVADGVPLLSMRDSDGTGRLYLQVSDDEPMFNLADSDSQGRVFLKVNKDGPIMWFNDAEGKPIYTQR